MGLNDAGIDRLVKAIYKQAAIDYIIAVLCGDEDRMEEAAGFMKEGDYLIKPDAGKAILRTCNEELAKSKRFIEAFIKSDKKKIKVENVSKWVLRLVVSVKYEKLLKLHIDKNTKECFLMKRKGAKNALMA